MTPEHIKRVRDFIAAITARSKVFGAKLEGKAPCERAALVLAAIEAADVAFAVWPIEASRLPMMVAHGVVEPFVERGLLKGRELLGAIAEAHARSGFLPDNVACIPFGSLDEVEMAMNHDQ